MSKHEHKPWKPTVMANGRTCVVCGWPMPAQSDEPQESTRAGGTGGDSAFRSAESLEMRAPGPTALDEMMRKANAYDDLRQVLIEARAEVDRWGHGDFHYGNSPRDKGVLAMLAKIDAALDEPGAGSETNRGER